LRLDEVKRGLEGGVSKAKKRVSRLQVEGAEGDALRGNVQCAAEGEFTGAAAECFFGANAGNVGRVVLLGEVREDEMLRARIE
jgi:hypothetical protein